MLANYNKILPKIAVHATTRGRYCSECSFSSFRIYVLNLFLPFNDSAGQYIGRYIFVNNSPASIARELPKPFTDAASFPGSIKKKIICFERGVFLGDVTKRTCSWIFDPIWRALVANPMSHFCSSNVLETRQSATSINPLIDLLACLELKLWPKNPILPQNQKIAENALSLPLASIQFFISRR